MTIYADIKGFCRNAEFKTRGLWSTNWLDKKPDIAAAEIYTSALKTGTMLLYQ